MLHLLRLVAPFKGLVALSALLGFATTGSSIGLMATSAYIISAAALHPSIATLQTAIVGVRFFGISRGVFRYLERYVSHQVTFHVLARVRVWFYTALEPLAPARLVQQHSGDLLARIVGDIESLENFYVRVLAPPLAAILIAGGMFTFLAGYEMSLALTLLAAMLCAGLGVPLLSRFLSRVPGQELVSLRAALNTSLVDGIQGMADLLASGQEQRRLEEIISLSHRLAKAQRRMALISGLQAFLTGLLSNLGMWAVLVLTIPLVRSGQVEGAYLAVLVLAALASFEAIQPLPQAAQHLESNLESARRLLALVDATPAVHDPPDPLTLPENLPTSSLNQSFSLEIRNLSFRYPEDLTPDPSPRRRGEKEEEGSHAPSLPYAVKDLTPGPSPRRRGEKEEEEGSRAPTLPYVLHDLSFNLREGQRVAIAGPSGAGKSTLVHLLLRFWEFDEGQILLGGQDLRRFNADDLREKIGVVSQNTTLFNATVRENLLIARPKATLEQIVQAAERARIHDFIESLPEGYETWIGERGLRLSGGERQRLAIARALLRDAPLLILDEATANLDPITEREVMESIYALMEGRTTLMITHRLTGLEAMDEILVLCRGRMVERGRHAELLAQGGVYHRMWELQRQRLMPSNEFLALRTGTRP